ncbi:site-specific integrase [Microcoleus sp. herbarium14]|uniref:tyrosine-type recombinase/integrase n=1 Tax=Microcoleus sp. herbarium14 TaxID=3055439 RepID=UPI002FD5B2DC
MKAQNKAQSDCDVKVAIDKGSIRLSFPKRHTSLWELMDSKSLKGKPKYLYLGKAGFSGDNPDDCKRAAQIAIAMEADLDHPEWDKLFDRTLEKYGLAGLLGGKYAKLADVLQMPGTVQALPEITVGEMWEDYLIWKEREVQPTTFKLHFVRLYTNALRGKVWDKKTQSYADTKNNIWETSLGDSVIVADKMLAISIARDSRRKLLLALNEAFLRAQSLGKIKATINPFHELWKQNTDTRDEYKSITSPDGEVIEWWQAADGKAENNLENDKRAFTKVERDIIIKAFYESGKIGERRLAPLIEFLFLTGCRPGEAFALRWQDIMFEHGVIRFSKSYNGKLKNIQRTKTGELRMFKLYPRLIELLIEIKPIGGKPTDLIFQQEGGKPVNSCIHNSYWNCRQDSYKGKTTKILGVVSRLVEEGKISQYLPPYHTRHTFITLTAHANSHNTSALDLLATACGNSVEIIVKHYLGVDNTTEVIHV